MKCNPENHYRHSIRLKRYDYSQAGAYFVTIVTQDRACLFGDVVDEEMRLNDAGRMVWSEWIALPQRFPTIELDAFVVMPNHVHGIIVILGAGLPVTVGRPHGRWAQTPGTVGAGLVPAPSGATTRVAPTVGDINGATTRVAPTIGDIRGATTRIAPTVGDIVGALKSITTVSYIRGIKQFGWPPFRSRLWQRNYYEHVIRTEESLNRIRQYIADNPRRWAFDRENPAAVAPEPEDIWRT